jgi:hypothetical protein
MIGASSADGIATLSLEIGGTSRSFRELLDWAIDASMARRMLN